MSKKALILVIGIILASAGFFLCFMGFRERFIINTNKSPVLWYAPVGMGLLGFAFVAFVVGAFTRD